MTLTLVCAKDTLMQQTTAEYFDRELGWESLYACNNKGFRPGKIWHWYERWVDVVRKHCRESGGEYREKSI